MSAGGAGSRKKRKIFSRSNKLDLCNVRPIFD
jgi:hypothetical protein